MIRTKTTVIGRWRADAVDEGAASALDVWTDHALVPSRARPELASKHGSRHIDGPLGQIMSSPFTKTVDLAGKRILVVEDEAAIAMLLEDMLEDLGCTIVGPVGNLAEADALARADGIDLALLDVNVAGQPIYPVVRTLAERGVPFVFSTGYGSSGIDELYRGSPILPKPFRLNDLEQKLLEAFGAL